VAEKAGAWCYGASYDVLLESSTYLVPQSGCRSRAWLYEYHTRSGRRASGFVLVAMWR